MVTEDSVLRGSSVGGWCFVRAGRSRSGWSARFDALRPWLQVTRPLRQCRGNSAAVPSRSEVAGGDCQGHARVVQSNMTSRNAKEFFSGGPKDHPQLHLDHHLRTVMIGDSITDPSTFDFILRTHCTIDSPFTSDDTKSKTVIYTHSPEISRLFLVY